MIDEKKLIEDILEHKDKIKSCDKRVDEVYSLAHDHIIDIINMQPKTDWIPCEERLPRRNVDVLVYRPKMAMPFFVDRYEGFYGEDDNEWHEGWAYSTNCEVIAWQPLPQPYK